MDEFVTEVFALLGIGLAVIGIRTYARITTVGIRNLKPDDYLMLLAAVLYAAESALAYSVGAFWHGLANNSMTDEARLLLDPASEEFRLRVGGSKTQVAGWSTYTSLLWLLKVCLCVFYVRLTEGLSQFRLRIHIGFALIGSTWLAVIFAILFSCSPMEKNWQIYPDPGNFCQPAISRIDIFVTVVLNVITDLYLLSIPMPMLWQANMKPLKKTGLMVLFSGGIFVTMAGILRCVLIITDPVNGAQQAGSWAVRETFVAVVTSNLPMIFPIIRRWASPIFSTIRSMSSRAGGRSGLHSDPQPGAFKLEEQHSRRGPRTANPITNFTFSDSEERIFDNNIKAALPSRSSVGESDADGPLPGGITKKVSVQVTESRSSPASLPEGDKMRHMDAYSLAQQASQHPEEERAPSDETKRAGINFTVQSRRK